MNPLKVLEALNLRITWKLIYIGLYGDKKIPVVLAYDDLFNYLYERLDCVSDETDRIVASICEKDSPTHVRSLLQDYCRKENSDISLQLRKWRVYLLKMVLENNIADPLQGLLEMIQFWRTIGEVANADPFVFPDNNSVSNGIYFSQSNYESLKRNCKIWMNQEINYIVLSEQQE